MNNRLPATQSDGLNQVLGKTELQLKKDIRNDTAEKQSSDFDAGEIHPSTIVLCEEKTIEVYSAETIMLLLWSDDNW